MLFYLIIIEYIYNFLKIRQVFCGPCSLGNQIKPKERYKHEFTLKKKINTRKFAYLLLPKYNKKYVHLQPIMFYPPYLILSSAGLPVLPHSLHTSPSIKNKTKIKTSMPEIKIITMHYKFINIILCKKEE